MRKKTLTYLLVSTFAALLPPVSVFAYEPINEEEKNILLQARAQVFGGSGIQAASEQTTINGEQPPIFGYDTADRVILAWKVRNRDAADFAQAAGIPPWMSLAKVSPITENQYSWDRWRSKPKQKNFYILAEIANTDRFIQGPLVEWKTFVTIGPDPVPKLVRFDVQHGQGGIDFLDLFAAPFGVVDWNVSDEAAKGIVTDGTLILDIDIPFKKASQGKYSFWDYYNWSRSNYSPPQRLSEEFLTAGERVFSTRGSQARYYYDGSAVSAKIKSVNLRDVQITNTFPWAEFTGPLKAAVVLQNATRHLVQPIGLPVEPDSGEAALFGQLTGMVLALTEEGQPVFSEEEVFGALQQASTSDRFPTLFFGVLDLYQSLQSFTGQELPKLQFSLKTEPKTVFINFEIPFWKARAFKKKFLPDNFQLAKIRFYPEQRRPVYAVSLNVYESVGQSVSGFRAEWSTYVINPDEENPKPRFSVLEAQTTSFGLDPLHTLEVLRSGGYDPSDLFSIIEGPAEVFDFSLDEENGLNITLRDLAEEIAVDVSVAYPSERRILRTRPLKSWMEANDFVYWGEIADVLKYDSNVMFADLIVFRAGHNDLIKDTAFSKYVNPRPLPIILWDGPQDLALEPWGNLQDIRIRE